jgi:uncharacterized protein (TIGR02271 family)
MRAAAGIAGGTSLADVQPMSRRPSPERFNNRATEEVRIPLAAERLRVGTRRRLTGLVRVRTRVEQRTALVDPPLRRQDLEIRRRRVDRFVDRPPGVRREGDTLIVPIVEEVVEEQLRTGKRAVTRGGVRIYTRVTERPVEEDMQLREERVHVDRRPVDRPAGAEAFRERSIEMEETREEPVIAKEARVTEEVVVSKDVEDRTERVRDTVRRTDVEVDRGHLGGFESDFRAHCTRTFGAQGLSYEQCAPAYQYGYALGSDRRYGRDDWTVIEADARRRWEERNPGTWERFKDAIRHAWDRARGERAPRECPAAAGPSSPRPRPGTGLRPSHAVRSWAVSG